MQQLFVSMYSYGAEWTALAESDRAEFGNTFLMSLINNPIDGLDLIGYAFNDPDVDHRAPYDFLCVYRADNIAVRRTFESMVKQSGWYRFFDQVNAGGSSVQPLAQLSAHAVLTRPRSTGQESISSRFDHEKKVTEVFGRRMAYVDEGSGPAVVFVHGDVMSSYLWREVLPYVQGIGRFIAVDLIGAGDSDKLSHSAEGSYGFAEHAKYFHGLLERLDLGDDIVFVGHDWGSNLAFDWAMSHEDRVAGIAFSEAVLPPFEWSDWPVGVRALFEAIRSPSGESDVLDRNLFVNAAQVGILRTLAPEEFAEITRPYAQPGEARRPTLAWPREVPFGDDDTDTRRVVEAQAKWLAQTAIPKLHVLGHPGAMAHGRRLDLVRSWPHLTEAVVRGYHWAPEDDPHGFGRALAQWLPSVLRPR